MSTRAEVDLYLIRHAQSAWNGQPDLICGRSIDVPLNTTGMEQSLRLGGALRQANIWPDVVFTSPAVRSRQTADYSLEAMGYRGPLIIDSDLHEVSQGKWEGQPRQKIYTEERVEQIVADPENFKAPDGESILEARERMLRFIGRVATTAEMTGALQTVFAFGHGFAIRILAGGMLNWPLERQRRHSETPNTSLTLLRYADGIWKPELVGQDAAKLIA